MQTTLSLPALFLLISAVAFCPGRGRRIGDLQDGAVLPGFQTDLHIGNYALGYGQTLDTAMKLPGYGNAHPRPQDAITDSRFKDVSLSYSHDVYANSRTGVKGYLSMGAGAMRSVSTDDYILTCPACTEIVAVPIPARKREWVTEFLFGGGVRVPVAKGLGLRGSVTVRRTLSASALYYGYNYNDLGVLVNPSLTAAAPNVNGDTLVSFGLGLYYRNRIPF